MNCITLNNETNFCVEKYNEKLRLIIKNEFEELACRKETLKNINYFLSEDDSLLFKGRLQLLKNESKIYILLNKEEIGFISILDFKAKMNKVI